MSNTERDAKDFKWHQGQSYVWGLNYGPARAQNDTVDWVVLVAVAPAVWRNWAAIRLALGRIYSDFRDYPEMVDIHPQHRGGREDEAASILASTGKPRGRITVGVPAKTGCPGDCGRRGFYFHSDIDSPKKAVTFDPIKCGYALLPTTNFLSF